MFHSIYIVTTIFIAPIICILIEFFIKHPRKEELKVLCYKWLVLWLGVRSVTAGLMQAMNPAYTARFLQLTSESHFMIQELGCANIGMGVLAALSFKFPQLQKPAAICNSVFLTGAAFLHIQRIDMIGWDETMSLLSDLYIIVVYVSCLLKGGRKTRIQLNCQK